MCIAPAGCLRGSEEGPLEPMPLTENSPLRTKLQTSTRTAEKCLQKLFGWIDERTRKLPSSAHIGRSSVARKSAPPAHDLSVLAITYADSTRCFNESTMDAA